MSGNEPESVYWDSCCFLSLLKDEDIPGKQGLLSMAELIDRAEVQLFVSTLVRVEVLTADMDAETRQVYDGILKRPNVHSVDVGIRVAEKARSLREFYRPDKPTLFGKKQLGIADSIHLATAILYGAEEFHTFDKRGRKDKDSEAEQKTIGLLKLSGDVAGHALTICPPSPKQLRIETASAPVRPSGRSPSAPQK